VSEYLETVKKIVSSHDIEYLNLLRSTFIPYEDSLTCMFNLCGSIPSGKTYGGEPWAFLVLLLLLHLSLLVGAFLVRDQFLPSQLICPNCRTMIPVGNFCQNCGTKGEIQVPTPIALIDNNN
jgi:hypothetical protein